MKNNIRKKLVLAITDPFCTAFIKGQAKYMKDKGFDVYLFSPKGEDVDVYVENEGCIHIEIPFSREISILKDLKSLLHVYKELKKIHPDVVNAGTPKAGLLCMMASKYLGIRNRIFTLRGLRSTAVPDGFKKKIVEFMEKLSVRYANKVISISPSMTNYAIEQKILSPNNTVIIGKASSNGVNTERFNLTNRKHSETIVNFKKYGIAESDFVLGYVGRIVKSKGIAELYDAFVTLSSKYDHLKFLIVGPIEFHSDSISDEKLNEIKNNSKVILTGKLSKPEYIYPLMNVFSLPSHNYREGFGNVAIEASASGVPIIVTNGAGCQDAVDENKSGKIVDVQNVGQLVAAIEDYILNPDIVKSHGEHGANFANTYYKNDVIWNGQYELYMNMIQNG